MLQSPWPRLEPLELSSEQPPYWRPEPLIGSSPSRSRSRSPLLRVRRSDSHSARVTSHRRSSFVLPSKKEEAGSTDWAEAAPVSLGNSVGSSAACCCIVFGTPASPSDGKVLDPAVSAPAPTAAHVGSSFAAPSPSAPSRRPRDVKPGTRNALPGWCRESVLHGSVEASQVAAAAVRKLATWYVPPPDSAAAQATAATTSAPRLRQSSPPAPRVAPPPKWCQDDVSSGTRAAPSHTDWCRQRLWCNVNDSVSDAGAVALESEPEIDYLCREMDLLMEDIPPLEYVGPPPSSPCGSKLSDIESSFSP